MRCSSVGAMVHDFENAGDVDGVFLSVATPGVFTPAYFHEIAEVLDRSPDGPPDPGALMAVMTRHGLTPAAPVPAGPASGLRPRPTLGGPDGEVHQPGIEPGRPFGHRDLNPARLPDSATGACGVTCDFRAAGPLRRPLATRWVGDGSAPTRAGPASRWRYRRRSCTARGGWSCRGRGRPSGPRWDATTPRPTPAEAAAATPPNTPPRPPRTRGRALDGGAGAGGGGRHGRLTVGGNDDLGRHRRRCPTPEPEPRSRPTATRRRAAPRRADRRPPKAAPVPLVTPPTATDELDALVIWPTTAAPVPLVMPDTALAPLEALSMVPATAGPTPLVVASTAAAGFAAWVRLADTPAPRPLVVVRMAGWKLATLSMVAASAGPRPMVSAWTAASSSRAPRWCRAPRRPYLRHPPGSPRSRPFPDRRTWCSGSRRHHRRC